MSDRDADLDAIMARYYAGSLLGSDVPTLAQAAKNARDAADVLLVERERLAGFITAADFGTWSAAEEAAELATKLLGRPFHASEEGADRYTVVEAVAPSARPAGDL